MSAKPWCELIKDAEKAFASWHERCERAKENYASLKKLANANGSREMQLLYANLEVIKPTIYARKPIPVCKPRFSDRRPVPRAASELIERALIASFDTERIHDTLIGVRDDLALYGRGVIWPRYKTEGQVAEPDPNTKPTEGEEYVEGFGEYVCYDHVNRKDFLHEPVRAWNEVGWVARKSWLTAKQGQKRFKGKWKGLHYTETENDTAEEYKVEKKAEVWEIWHKGRNVVVWIHPKADEVLDMQEPWLDLEGFFPCPKPAYGVTEPESLIPVPDYLFYKDQLEEVNALTARIASLSEALRLKGFYSAGAENVGSAVEKAFQSTDDNAVMIPVPTVAALGQGMKDAIVWMPLVDIANTITALVNLRKQLIEDIFQISGISDIMRGETKATETATAQNIKAQFGSVRVRTKQEEMIRVADDTMLIAGEIMAENFQPETLMKMSSVERIVPGQLIQQHEALKKQQAMMAQQAQAAQQAGQPPQPMPPLPQLPPLPKEAVAAEEVFGLLRDQRMRPFVLQTASDSTIQPNEDAEKQRRNEFATSVSGLLTAAGPIVQAAPEAATLVGEMLRFVTGAYRAGRDMEQTIDDFIAKLAEKASQPPPPPPPDPKIELAKMDMEDKKAEREAKMMERQQAQQAKQQDDAVKRQAMMEDRAMKQEDARLKAAEAMQKAQTDAMMKTLDLKLKEIDLAVRQLEIVATAEQAEQARRAESEKAEQDEYREMERGMKDEAKERQTAEQSAKRDQAQDVALSKVAEGLAAIAEAQRTLSESLTRPKTIKFNEQGRPVGIQ